MSKKKWRYEAKHDPVSAERFPHSYGVWDNALGGWTSLTRTSYKVANRQVKRIYEKTRNMQE